MKPPVAYFGGKITLAPQIVDLFSPHRHYVEPYCGSLAVLLAKAPSAHETVNDLDQRLMTFWRMLRDRPEDLARVCALTPHARAEHEQAMPLDATDDLEVARQVFIRLTQGRSGVLRKSGSGWRYFVKPTGSTSMPDYLASYFDRLAPAAERLQHVSLESLPALDIIAKYGAEPNVLLYVDPPYVGSTRANDNAYRHEMRSDRDHRELAVALRRARAAVVISGYPSDLYDLELYPDWYRHTMAAGTGQGDGWGNRTEVLWSNRPLGTQQTLFAAPSRSTPEES